MDTKDLKSPDLNSRAGSSPAPGTTTELPYLATFNYSLPINNLRLIRLADL